jgi:hypothetical protein
MFNGLWFRVFEASGLIFKGSWSRAYGPGFRVYGPGFRVYGPGFRVLGPPKEEEVKPGLKVQVL